MHKHEYELRDILSALDEAISDVEALIERTRGENVALTQLETARFWLQNELIESDYAGNDK